MSYRIRYGPTKKHSTKEDNFLVFTLLFLWAALFVFVCVKRGSLLPGDSTVTAAAIENMVQAVSSGENAAQAFYSFCLEVIDGAAHPY